MSIENIGLQEITVVAGKEIPNQVAVQGDNAARGLSIKLLGSNHKIIKDPLIQVFWNYEIVGDDGVYTLENPVEGMYKAGRYEIQYPSQLGAMSGVALAQVQFKQGNKTLFSIPYKIRVYKQVGVVGSSIPSGVINIFDKALADALEELNQMSKATKEYMVKTTADVEKAFKSEMQLIFNSLESDVNELEFLIAKWESESTEYLNNLKAQGDKAVADLHVQLDETAEQLIDELRADLKIEYDKKQAEIDSITDDLVLQKIELEKLQERITTNTNTIEQLTVDFESKINQHIIDSDNRIDNHLSLYETKFTEYATQSTQKIDQAIADMAGALDDDIERIVSEKVDEFADGLSERVTSIESEMSFIKTNKADKSDLIGLATEKYVDDKISEIPEVDLTDIENDISSLKTNKADKTDMTSQLSLKADKTELTPINKEIDNLKSSGVESNRIMVEALNSKGIQASIDNSIRENANKINDIKVGDYSIGDICKRVEEVWTEGEELDKPEVKWTFSEHNSWVYAVAVDNNGNVYSGSIDKTVRKISPSGEEIWTFSGRNIVNSVAVDNNGNVYSGSWGKTVKKISPDGEEIWTFSGHSHWVYAVAVDDNGNVYSGSQDRTVKKISSSGEEIWTFSGHSNTVNSVAVDNNGNVYSGSVDSTVKKISPDGKEIWTFSGHGSTVNSVAVDNNGNVYSGSQDRTVKKISSSGEEIWTFSGHSDIVNSVAVDNNGNVYSGSKDETVRKISPSGEEIWTFSGHSDIVNSVAVDNNGNVYSGSNDETVKKLLAGIPPKLIGYKILE